jgi:hypothetical protein
MFMYEIIKDITIPNDEIWRFPERFFAQQGDTSPPALRVLGVPKQEKLILFEIHFKPTVVRQFVDLEDTIIVYFFDEAVMVSVKKIAKKVTVTLKKIS